VKALREWLAVIAGITIALGSVVLPLVDRQPQHEVVHAKHVRVTV